MHATIIKPEAAKALGVNTARLEHLDQFMQQITDDGTHSGSIIRVLRHGVEIFSGAYGVRVPEVLTPGGIPATMDTICPLSSVTKAVTATLLAILQEDGVIDFCDRLNRYYPDFIGDKKETVEIWQLLSHSSGMSDDIIENYVGVFLHDQLGLDPDAVNTPEAIAEACRLAREFLGLPAAEGEDAINETVNIIKLRAPLARDPHTGFEYCSTAYGMLGNLIEKLSGESIDSFAARRLFGPLGMTDTHFILPKEKWQRVIKRDPSYVSANWLNSENVLSAISGAGGLKSTMRDLTLLGQMYLNQGVLGGQEVLSPASIRVLSSDQNADLPPASWFGRMLSAAWTPGWVVSCGKKDDLGLLRSDRTLDHGGMGGARLVIDPDSGLVIAMYLVDRELYTSYANHSRIANIIYSALR